MAAQGHPHAVLSAVGTLLLCPEHHLHPESFLFRVEQEAEQLGAPTALCGGSQENRPAWSKLQVHMRAAQQTGARWGPSLFGLTGGKPHGDASGPGLAGWSGLSQDMLEQEDCETGSQEAGPGAPC